MEVFVRNIKKQTINQWLSVMFMQYIKNWQLKISEYHSMNADHNINRTALQRTIIVINYPERRSIYDGKIINNRVICRRNSRDYRLQSFTKSSARKAKAESPCRKSSEKYEQLHGRALGHNEIADIRLSRIFARQPFYCTYFSTVLKSFTKNIHIWPLLQRKIC